MADGLIHGKEHSPLWEETFGIGAQDADPVAIDFFGPGAPTTVPAGRAYVHARREANWQRRRAFDRIPSYATLTPAGNHPANGATEAELRLGCPAWPR